MINDARTLSERPWARWLLRGVAALAALYVVALLGAVVFQRNLLYLANPRPGGPEVPGAAIQKVSLVTADGEHLIAWWLPARPGRPTTLFFDGRGGALSMQGWRFRRLAKAGVGGFAVAYRGFGGSSGSPSEEGLHQDARAAYAWIAARVPADQLVIHGLSLGSGVAVRLAGERPARALILEAPFTSAVDEASRRLPIMPVALFMRDRFPSLSEISAVHMPVLIIHGDADSIIPFSDAERLYARANAPKVLVRMRGADHLTLVRDGLYDHVWRFLGVSSVESTAAPGHLRATTIVTSSSGVTLAPPPQSRHGGA